MVRRLGKDELEVEVERYIVTVGRVLLLGKLFPSAASVGG